MAGDEYTLAGEIVITILPGWLKTKRSLNEWGTEKWYFKMKTTSEDLHLPPEAVSGLGRGC